MSSDRVRKRSWRQRMELCRAGVLPRGWGGDMAAANTGPGDSWPHLAAGQSTVDCAVV